MCSNCSSSRRTVVPGHLAHVRPFCEQVLQLRALRTAYNIDIAVLRARRLELGSRLQVCEAPSVAAVPLPHALSLVLCALTAGPCIAAATCARTITGTRLLTSGLGEHGLTVKHESSMSLPRCGAQELSRQPAIDGFKAGMEFGDKMRAVAEEELVPNCTKILSLVRFRGPEFKA